MNKISSQFETYGITIPHILLPAPGIDKKKWAVVACDQYTSEPEYWENVENYVGDSPSTLKLIFPEVYLNDGKHEERIRKIHAHMEEYTEQDLLTSNGPGFILVDRKTKYTKSRKGLMLALDLEQYNYHQGAKTLIRASEGTILERLPPRIRIRRNAPLELPHILVLIDDSENTVMGPIVENMNSLPIAYDTDLMMEGGHITGYTIHQEEMLHSIAEGFSSLSNPEGFQKKYGKLDIILFAVGDGNHSLATAKAVWEEIKSTSTNVNEIMNHPARYALVEMINMYDPGLKFEPIHRVVFNVEPSQFILDFLSWSNGHIQSFSDTRIMQEELSGEKKGDAQMIGFIHHERMGVITILEPSHYLAAGTLQNFLDFYFEENKEAYVDYIHSWDTVEELGKKHDNVGLFLPPLQKASLFSTVIQEGVLPKKSFSIGEEEEKRYYMEARRIIP